MTGNDWLPSKDYLKLSKEAVFLCFDQNGEGWLNVQEFKDFVEAHEDFDDDAYEKYFAFLDQDANG